MRENFLHHLWKQQKFGTLQILTTENEAVTIIEPGNYNENAGPDFLNARLAIGETMWAGHIEIHIKASDWHRHGHGTDEAYSNVVLHVVWLRDVDILHADGSIIPVIQLKDHFSEDALEIFQSLFEWPKKWINCEADLIGIDKSIQKKWLYQMYLQRLELKSDFIKTILVQTKTNWETALFKVMSFAFGMQVNGSAFLSIANSFDFSLIRKLRDNIMNLEALLLGQAGLLDQPNQDNYLTELRALYTYLKHKFKLKRLGIEPVKMLRLRPASFPMARLSQLADLYHRESGLLNKVLHIRDKGQAYSLFNAKPSMEINQKKKEHCKGHLSKSFIDKLIINVVVPVQYSYAQYRGEKEVEWLAALVHSISPERNRIIRKFSAIGLNLDSALDTQAALQLKQHFCDKNKCLQCDFGHVILNRNM